MNNYTVYMHKSPSNKVYIGITQQKPEQRWGNGRYYRENAHFNNAITKYGWENFSHEILFEGLNKEEAEQKEIELIKQYKAQDSNYGYNIANGGSSVGMHSDKTKKKISENNSRYWKGKHLPREVIEKQLETKRKRGYFKTEEEKKQRRKEYSKKHYEEHKVLKGRKKRIFTEEDKKKYSEMSKKMWSEASEEKKKRILANLINDGSNRKGKHLSEETKEKLRQANLGKKYSEETKKKKSETLKRLYAEGKKKRQFKAVEQLDKEGNVIRRWEGALQATRELGYDNSSISACCRGKKELYLGYKWRYADD